MPRKGSVPLHSSNSSFHVEQLPAGTGDVPPRKREGLCLVGFHNFVPCFGTSDIRHLARWLLYLGSLVATRGWPEDAELQAVPQHEDADLAEETINPT